MVRWQWQYWMESPSSNPFFSWGKTTGYYSKKGDLIIKMGKFPAYGMAGIGIAAAIGFVFALTILSSNPAINPEQTQEADTFRQMSEPDTGAGEESAAKLAEDQGQSAQLMMQEGAGVSPTLASILALNADTGELIGEVVPEMQFAANEPVLIQANIVSQNAVASHMITLAVRSDADDSQNYVEAANLRGNIGADSNLMLELYWNPASTGQYTLLLLSANADESLQPIAEIPIRVVDAAQ